MNELITIDTKELSPERLGGEIRLLTAQARRMALSYAIQIGYRLHLAHEKVGPHGWAEWLKKETEFSASAASRLESLYEGYGEDQGSLFGVGNKFPTLENLSISNALALLAVPEEEREAVADELDAEHLSARELDRALKERDEAVKRAELAERRARDVEESLEAKEQEEADRIFALQQKLEEAERAAEDVGPYREKLEAAELTAKELREQIRELEQRPQPVAVEKDEKAVEEAVAAARREAQAELEATQKKLENARKKQEKAEKERDALKEQAAKAETAAQEKADTAVREAAEKLAAAERVSAQIRQEAEELRKKLAASDRDVTEFGVHFKTLQGELHTLNETLSKIEERDGALGAKLRGALRQILAPFAGSETSSGAATARKEEETE